MFQRVLIYIAIAMVGVLTPTTASAQSVYTWSTLQFVEQGSAWLSGGNPAGLNSLDSLRITEISASATKGSGGLVNYFESGDYFNYGAGARSLFRYNKRVVLSGAVGYDKSILNNTSGSVLINPNLYPFDITEVNRDMSGKKLKESYSIEGGIAINILQGLDVGANFSLCGTNYSKLRDLRHLNTLSELDFDLGFRYIISDFLFGVTYTHLRGVESLSFNRFYDSDSNIEILINYGNFWGDREVFSPNSYDGFISTTPLPIVSHTNKYSAQLSYNITPKSQVYLSGDYSVCNGDVGIVDGTRPIFLGYTSSEQELHLSYVSSLNSSRHIMQLAYENKEQATQKNKYEIVNQSNGESYLKYYEPDKVNAISNTTTKLVYRFQGNIHDGLPKFEIESEADLLASKRYAILYPYNQSDNYSALRLKLRGKYNIQIKSTLLSPSIAFDYRDVLSNTTKDGSVVDDASQKAPFRADNMYMLADEFRGLTLFTISPSFGYAQNLKNGSILGLNLTYCLKLTSDKIRYLSSDNNHIFTLTTNLTF